MLRSIAAIILGSALLASFCIAQMQFFSLIFDNNFALVVPGMAGAACCFALAVYSNRSMKSLSIDGEADADAVSWFAPVALIASGSLIAPFNLPLGSVVVFLLLAFLLLPIFFCWTYGVKILVGRSARRTGVIAVASLAGVVIGFLATPWMLEYAGGSGRLGWLIVIALSITVLLLSGKNSLLYAVTVVLVVSAFGVVQLNVSRQMLPHWAQGNQTQLKPVLGEMAPGRSMKGVAVYEDASGRTDLAMINDEKNRELGWVLTNGSSPVPLLVSGKEKPLAWWQEQFPLVSLPFEVGNPGRILSIGVVPGPEVQIAKKLNRNDIHVFSLNKSLHDFLALFPDQSLGRQFEHLTEVKAGSPLSILREQDDTYEMIFLPITQPGWNGWFASNPGEAYLYTVEAIQKYLGRIETGGMLVMTTREEVLFVRGLLTAWDALEGMYGRKIEIERHVLGVRLSSQAPNRGSYQNLLMIFKDGIPDDVKSRLHQVTDNPNVELLFGAGSKPVPPYTVLSHAGGLITAKKVMKNLFSRHYRIIADLETTTDLRPGFFQVLRDYHPFLKWLFTVALAVLLGCLLFPFPSLRSIDNAGDEVRPPIPTMLGYFLLSGAGLAMLTAGELQLEAMLSIFPQNSSYSLFAALVAGLGAGLLVSGNSSRHGSDSWRQWFSLVMILPVFLAGWMMASAAGVVAAWASWQQAAFLLSVVLLGGVVAGMQLLYGMQKLSECQVNLVPWAWIVSGSAVLAGAILAYWLAQFWGWNLVFILSGGCFLLSAGIGFWAWSPLQVNRSQASA